MCCGPGGDADLRGGNATQDTRERTMSDSGNQRGMTKPEDEAPDADMPFGRLAPPRSPAQVYSVRIPVDRLEELRGVAASRGVPPSTLLREWVLNRLDEQRIASLDTFEVRLMGDFAVDSWRLSHNSGESIALLGRSRQ